MMPSEAALRPSAPSIGSSTGAALRLVRCRRRRRARDRRRSQAPIASFSPIEGGVARGRADRIEVIKTPEGYSWRETPGASAAAEAITAAEPASPAKTPKVKRDRAPSAPVAPAVAPKPRQRANFEALEASARAGNLPQPPDFSAATHARFRGKLARLADLAAAGDVEALRTFEINPVSSSPKAMARYRDLCVIALPS